ncbi:MAG: GlsB/YeaQ/YmgE family stress response membrane protein [Gaiellaceae bacterium]
MNLIVFLIVLIAGGYIVGGLARFALPGPDPMPWYSTVALGIGGSIVGGFIGAAIVGRPGGLFFALVGAVLLLGLYRKYVQHRPVFRA